MGKKKIKKIMLSTPKPAKTTIFVFFCSFVHVNACYLPGFHFLKLIQSTLVDFNCVLISYLHNSCLISFLNSINRCFKAKIAHLSD